MLDIMCTTDCVVQRKKLDSLREGEIPPRPYAFYLPNCWYMFLVEHRYYDAKETAKDTEKAAHMAQVEDALKVLGGKRAPLRASPESFTWEWNWFVGCRLCETCIVVNSRNNSTDTVNAYRERLMSKGFIVSVPFYRIFSLTTSHLDRMPYVDIATSDFPSTDRADVRGVSVSGTAWTMETDRSVAKSRTLSVP